MRKHFYGAGLIGLGVWEAIAFASRGRVPTVSRTVGKCPKRKTVLVLWMAGAVVHIFRHKA